MGCPSKTTPQSYKNIEIPPQVNLTEEQRKQVMMQVIDILLKSGLPNMGIEIACGIAGNIKVESMDFNYTAIGDSGTSYGLCQWHETRMVALYNYCKEIGKPFNSVEGQMQYLIHELSSVNRYKQVYANISSQEHAKDIDYITEYFCKYFESPKNYQTYCKTRIPKGRQVFQEYTKLKPQS